MIPIAENDMTRDFEFSRNTKADLAFAAQFRCVRPGCNQPTHFFDQTTGKWKHFGVAAHDAPASLNEGGERADNDLTPDQKKAYGNGAWLCRNCSTIVDIAQKYFPLKTLPLWQEAAAQAIQNNALSPVQPSSISFTEAAGKVEKFLDLAKPILFNLYQNVLTIPVPTIHAISRILAESSPLLPLRPYSGLFPHIVNVQQRILDTLRAIKAEVTDLSSWHTSGGYYRCNTASFGAPSGLAERFKESHARVLALVNDFWVARDYLHDFILGRVNHHALYL
jgi:hypothetical protein